MRRYAWLIWFIGLSAVAQSEVKVVREKLARARQALSSPKLTEDERRILKPKVNAAEKALDTYVSVVQRGDKRAAAVAPLYAAGGTLLADESMRRGLRMVVSDELTLRLLSVRRAWTDQGRLNTAITALLLLEQDGAHFDAAWEGIKEGRYRVDSKLIADFYAVLPKRLRVELLASRAGRRLDPKTFRALFVPLFRDRSLTPKQRRRLAQWSLSANIGPKNAEENRDLILEMLRSKDTSLVLRGVLEVEYLNYLSREDLDIIKRKLQTRDNLRYAACAALTKLARRHKEIHPSVLEYCLQPSISRIAHRIYRKDREAPGRVAGFFLLEALHHAGGPIAPGVRPRWAAYDKRFGRPRSSKRSTRKR